MMMEKNFLLTWFTKKNIFEYSIIRLLKEFPEDVSEALLSYYYMGEAAVTDEETLARGFRMLYHPKWNTRFNQIFESCTSEN